MLVATSHKDNKMPERGMKRATYNVHCSIRGCNKCKADAFGEHWVREERMYSRRVMEMTNILNCAGHSFYSVGSKRTFFRGLRCSFDKSTEHILGGDYRFENAVYKLTV